MEKLNSFQKFLIGRGLSKIYGDNFSFNIIENGYVSVKLKESFSKKNKSFLYLPDKKYVLSTIKKYAKKVYEKNKEDIKVRVLIDNVNLKDLEIIGEGCDLKLGHSSFVGGLSIRGVNNLILDGCISIFGEFNIFVQSVDFDSSTLFIKEVESYPFINCKKLYSHYSNFYILGDKKAVIKGDILDFYHSNISSNKLKLNSENLYLKNNDFETKELDLNSDYLFLESNTIQKETDSTIVIDSKNIDSKNNNIRCNNILIENEENDGIEGIIANTVIYNNEELKDNITPDLYLERQKLINSLKKAKDKIINLNEKTIKNKTEVIKNELNNKPIQKILNK